MTPAALKKLWDDAWREGLWAASWQKALEGLTPEEAAWKPAPGRNSIWQITLHMVFWREDALRRLAEPGAPKPTDDELVRANFPAPAEVSAPAWEGARERFRASHERVSAVLVDERTDATRLQYLLMHDCYHVGQIMLLRALLEKPPIE